jgi:hypothetical protein
MNGRSWILWALPLAACAPPEDALVSSCTTAMLSLSTECRLRAVKLPQSRSFYSHIDANTKNFKVRVSATFSVQKGRVTVAIPGCTEGGSAEVTVERPASIQCDTALNRSTFTFAVVAKTGEGAAEGFAGSLTFRPI